ncbi:MAG: GNAT family N-acetyltransferase [Patescibacteria group bacterium]|jgi:GNAT superfamily N-acetyltransferase
MEIKQEIKKSEAVKIFAEKNGEIVGRAYLYLIKNDLHTEPYGLLEDVFVSENQRGKGTGTKLVQAVIEEAKKRKCYKLIATSRKSREQVHQWYLKLGFEDYGCEFRINF